MPGYRTQLNNPLVAAINNNTFTTARDICFSTTQAPFKLPANYLRKGDTLRTFASGTFSTTGTPTLVFGVYYNAVVLGVNVALTTASGAVTLPWELDCRSVVQNDGTAGAIVTSGQLVYGTSLTALTTIPIPGIALADVAVDTTVTSTWTVMATWSASSASNIVITRDFTVEHLNFKP
jgi:hypothetical protein